MINKVFGHVLKEMEMESISLFSKIYRWLGQEMGLINTSNDNKPCCHNVYRLWNIFHDILVPL